MIQYTLEMTSYDDGEAEYDAVDYPAQIIVNADTDDARIVALCTCKGDAEHIINLLKAHPLNEVA